MQSLSPEALLSVAVKAAQTGGRHAREHTARREEAVETHAHDVKLALDVECQVCIENVIRKHYPEHAILGEEDETHVNGNRLGAAKTPRRHSADYEWVVDPIDGTVNFSHGFSAWCSAVAVRQGDRVLAGAVYAPQLDALYAASINTPATRNGNPIQVSSRQDLADCIVMTGLDKNLVPGVAPLAFLSRIASTCRKARIMGSAALDLCLVADGTADGYFEGNLYLWDIAAAGLIVQQAGGKGEIVANLNQPHQLNYVASNGHIHDDLKHLVTLGGGG